jgi:hypothetical protein
MNGNFVEISKFSLSKGGVRGMFFNALQPPVPPLLRGNNSLELRNNVKMLTEVVLWTRRSLSMARAADRIQTRPGRRMVKKQTISM